jgi:SpoIVB peptidase S55
MRLRTLLCAWLCACAALPALAQTPLLRLADVQAGMKGTGKTVFSGTRIEDFQVEVLGVLENIAPKQSLIVVRLSGGPLERVGVMQGMSGSPVFIGGKLVGAVAMSFPFSKEPIAGIRPIEDMLSAGTPPPAASRAASAGGPVDLLAGLDKPAGAVFGQSRLSEIATPVSFAGFTAATLERFAPQLRGLGLEPVQGVTGRGRAAIGGKPGPIEPGSMISVQLMAGDLSIAADGTVTHIDGNRLWAFGHRFLSVGSTDMPFSRAEVIALLPSVQSSFKISASREIAGSISQDRSTAVSGQVGGQASLMPLRISVQSAGKSSEYRMEMVKDRFLSPFLLQMSLFSTIDSTERMVGTGSLAVRGAIEFEGPQAPVRLDNVFAAESGAASMASLITALPLAYVMQGGFDSLKVKDVHLEVESFDEKRQLQVDQVFTSRAQVRPGESVELTVSLAGEKGAELTRKVRFAVPPGMQTGPLYFTVSDATTANLAELRQVILTQPKTAGQLLSVVSRLKTNTKAYVRVWRADPSYQVQSSELPDPPPSVSMLLARANANQGLVMQSFQSKIAEFEIDAGGRAVSGVKTAQVEIKE